MHESLTPANENEKVAIRFAADAEENLGTLLRLSEELHGGITIASAFHALMAAGQLALTPTQLSRVRTIAVQRRDEPLLDGCERYEGETHRAYVEMVESIDRLAAERHRVAVSSDDAACWRVWGWEDVAWPHLQMH